MTQPITAQLIKERLRAVINQRKAICDKQASSNNTMRSLRYCADLRTWMDAYQHATTAQYIAMVQRNWAMIQYILPINNQTDIDFFTNVKNQTPCAHN